MKRRDIKSPARAKGVPLCRGRRKFLPEKHFIKKIAKKYKKMLNFFHL